MNTAPPQLTQALTADPTALNGLRFSAGQGGEKGKTALKETARQFEALFMREVIKSMREATMKSGLLDGGSGESLGQDLLDQQLAGHLAGQPGGLSAAIERQLSRQMSAAKGGSDLPVDGSNQDRDLDPAPLRRHSTIGNVGALGAYGRHEAPARASDAAKAVTIATAAPGERSARFVDAHSDAAEQVSKETGIPSSFMLGQAGHETGWGKSEIRNRDGSPSFNLFGIKATSGWKGKVAEVVTTEYIGGQPRKTVAKFRAYDSYEDSFRDYARLVSKSPRYAQAMDKLDSAQGYARSLQKGGYATDPQYAHKLGRAINMALALQRAQDS